jgi:hypothetical protein
MGSESTEWGHLRQFKRAQVIAVCQFLLTHTLGALITELVVYYTVQLILCFQFNLLCLVLKQVPCRSGIQVFRKATSPGILSGTHGAHHNAVISPFLAF